MTVRLRGSYLVTGGAGGIGADICRSIQQAGANEVIVCDRDAVQAGRVAQRIPGARSVVVDLSSPSEIEQLIDTMTEERVRLSGIVHAAAMLGTHAFPAVDEPEWLRMAQVNVLTLYALAARGRHLLEDDSSIVAISSVEGSMVVSTGGATQPAYATSKAALEMLVKSLAVDLGPSGIRVNTVAPGFIETPMSQAALGDPSRRTLITDQIALGGRLGVPGDISGPVVFLLSRLASYITGETLHVDGGFTLGLHRGAQP